MKSDFSTEEILKINVNEFKKSLIIPENRKLYINWNINMETTALSNSRKSNKMVPPSLTSVQSYGAFNN